MPGLGYEVGNVAMVKEPLGRFIGTDNRAILQSCTWISLVDDLHYRLGDLDVWATGHIPTYGLGHPCTGNLELHLDPYV